jgi:hypothetical protein
MRKTAPRGWRATTAAYNPTRATWLANTVVPDTSTLGPGQSTVITVTAEPPVGFLGNQVLDVNAFHAAGIAGGVTLTV